MKRFDTLKHIKTSPHINCIFTYNIWNYVIILSIIAFLICWFGLYKKLSSVKKQLESCRSSMRSSR
jgi:hypothetical protein